MGYFVYGNSSSSNTGVDSSGNTTAPAASRYTFNSYTTPTSAQKSKLTEAVTSSNSAEQLQTNYNAALRTYYGSIDYSKQWGEEHFPSMCVIQACLTAFSEKASANGADLQAVTNLSMLKTQVTALNSALTSLPFELLHTVSPVQFVLAQPPLFPNAKSSEVLTVDPAGATFGTFSNQYVVLSTSNNNTADFADPTTIIHELGHVFRRSMLVSFKKDSGFDYEWQQADKRPYASVANPAVYRPGASPSNGYVSTYAASSLGEDMAETFTFLVQDIHANSKSVDDITDTQLKAKAKVLQKYIQKYVPEYEL